MEGVKTREERENDEYKGDRGGKDETWGGSWMNRGAKTGWGL